MKLNILSDEEIAILDGFSRGLTYAEVAEQQNIKLGTLRNHIERLYWKLDVRFQAHAVGEAYRRGYLTVDAAP